MSEMRKTPFKNPGWAGNTGEFDLTEAQVRGDDYVGKRPTEGGHPSGASTYPYMLAEKDPEGPIFVMASSGSTKGGFGPIAQLAGMRGLMADPSGRIIKLPILVQV